MPAHDVQAMVILLIQRSWEPTSLKTVDYRGWSACMEHTVAMSGLRFSAAIGSGMWSTCREPYQDSGPLERLAAGDGGQGQVALRRSLQPDPQQPGI